MSDLSREEFLAHVGYIREDISGVHTRMDLLNGRTRQVEGDIAVLKDRATDARAVGRTWGAGAGAAVGGFLTVVWHWMTGAK